MLINHVKKWTLGLSLGLIVATALSSCGQQETAQQTNQTTANGDEACAPEITEIDFGILSTESQDTLKPKWDPFVKAIETAIGRKLNAFYATDYGAVVEAMAVNKVQLAWLGGKSYIEAADRADAEVFARVVNADGTKGYYSHLITTVDHPILGKINIEKGDGDQYVTKNAPELTFAFNDPNSTSGYLIPSYYVFAKNSVDPTKIFKKVIFAGNHEATIQAVANKQVDVASNSSEVLANVEASDPELRKKIQIIWTSPEIPSDPVAYRKDLPDCLKEKVKDFVYNYKDKTILEPLGWSGFEAAEDKDWNPMRELKIGTEILEVQNDAKLPEAEKQQKLKELNEKLETLK
ncbi:phosphonate ABC transporter, periplasmic phosphonate binding protein [Rippkaea orientalis PCC 8801]|uniref:Phosphonate ABC transporter, periplasmic phosphonate binding protein n=1 Tax=Rippkaea orientalis (strain PCC 8801 / RF-1) TaxID=41431 RepID=B7K4A1_RIPO1|nr:phosphonate ABC transporter substrate-binding protein [Rippkaea orientalis]ACK67807.1 phosphonate ABC transporter, periplasmic phosphonate binding protein [Rippkaea orientalis PCC 8801]